MNLENIPAALRALPQWVACAITPTGDGHTRKMPVDPQTGLAAKTNDPATWGTCAQAVDRMTRDELQAVGLVFTESDPYCGIDFDHVIDVDGQREQWVTDYLRLLNSYAEVSQSGTGVHVICRASLPPGGRHGARVEMYDRLRFFVMTGDVIDGYTELRDAQDAVNLIHREQFPPSQPTVEHTPRLAQTVDLADADLIAKAQAAKNGARFTALWQGNTAGYPSHSEADAALCSLLAFWTGGDAGRVDSLFRQSGLLRPKWDERHSADATYGAMTIAHALRGITQFYDGNGRQPPDVSYAQAEPADAEPPAWLGEDGSELPALPTGPQRLNTPAGGGPVAPKRGASWADMAELIGPVAWEWRDWLPAGLLVELVADSGVGKSILALRIAATYLKGWPWPDGSPYTGATGKVLWVEAEAGQAVNLERAQAWGLPIANIVSPFENPLDDASLFDATHIAAITAEASQDDVRLIVVDSLSGGTAGREKGEDQMPVVKWLAELARNLGKPVLLLHHLRKRGLSDAGEVVTLDRVRGSTVIVQPARVVWALDAPNANEADHRRLSVIKSNLGRFPEAVGMRIADTGVTFDAAPQAPKPETQADKAIDLLRALLARGPMKVSDLETEANGAGISWRTFNTAKEKLGIVARKERTRGGAWTWALPYRTADTGEECNAFEECNDDV